MSLAADTGHEEVHFHARHALGCWQFRNDITGGGVCDSRNVVGYYVHVVPDSQSALDV